MLAESNFPQYVSPPAIELLPAQLEDLPGEPGFGFFGPDSVTWRVNRESAVFLGAGRAALLQLAHPWVAAALLQHSSLLHDATARFHSTFRVIYTMLFGTRAQALAASRQVYRLHTTIRGELPQAIGSRPLGEHYEANEVEALRWVYATLVESAVLAYEFAIKPLPAAEREQYYAESKRFAALFGIPAGMLPSDWRSFLQYTAETVESPLLAVDQNARALGHSVLSGAGTWLRPPHWYLALTAFWMPPGLRTGFELPFGPRDELSVRQTARLLPLAYSCLPRTLRWVGPFREAEARLRGRLPGPFTRRSNRFWTGLPRMLYPPLSGDLEHFRS